MTKEFTKDGMREIEEINVDIIREPKRVEEQIQPNTNEYENLIPPPTSEYIREKRKEFNENPSSKRLGTIAIGKKTYIALWIIVSILLILLTLNIFWDNINVTMGKYKGNVTVTNNLPENPININDNDIQNFNNSFTIENQNNVTVIIDMGEEMGNLTSELEQTILNLQQTILNLTNSS